jgi:hypothetical protein
MSDEACERRTTHSLQDVDRCFSEIRKPESGMLQPAENGNHHVQGQLLRTKSFLGPLRLRNLGGHRREDLVELGSWQPMANSDNNKLHHPSCHHLSISDFPRKLFSNPATCVPSYRDLLKSAVIVKNCFQTVYRIHLPTTWPSGMPLSNSPFPLTRPTATDQGC